MPSVTAMHTVVGLDVRMVPSFLACFLTSGGRKAQALGR